MRKYAKNTRLAFIRHTREFAISNTRKNWRDFTRVFLDFSVIFGIFKVRFFEIKVWIFLKRAKHAKNTQLAYIRITRNYRKSNTRDLRDTRKKSETRTPEQP